MSTNQYLHFFPAHTVVRDEDDLVVKHDEFQQPQFNVPFGTEVVLDGMSRACCESLLDLSWTRQLASPQEEFNRCEAQFMTGYYLYDLCGRTIDEELIVKATALYTEYVSYVHQYECSPEKFHALLTKGLGLTFYIRTD